MINATEFLKENIGTIGAGVGGVALGSGVGYLAGRSSNRKKSRKRKSAAHKNTRKRSHSHKRRQRYTPHTAGNRKDTSHRRIRYTSKGQPYRILASGKAMFIKKSSARASHKRKGGRY